MQRTTDNVGNPLAPSGLVNGGRDTLMRLGNSAHHPRERRHPYQWRIFWPNIRTSDNTLGDLTMLHALEFSVLFDIDCEADIFVR